MTQAQEKANSQIEIQIRTELYNLIKDWLMKNRPETWANIQTNIINSDPIQKFLAKQRIDDGDTADSIFNHEYFQADLEGQFPAETSRTKTSKPGFILKLFGSLHRQKNT